MNKFRDALYRFMYGRNGVDALNWALVILELVVSILSAIIRVQGVSQALYFVSMVLMFIVLIRIFSRNLARPSGREREVSDLVDAEGQRHPRRAGTPRPTRRTKYVRCSCGAYCRVPKNIGKVELTCPKCGKKKVVKT